MNLNRLLCFIFLLFHLTSFSQQLEYSLNVVDIGISPANVKSPYFSFTMGEKAYLVSSNNGDYDLIEYDGDTTRILVENVDGGITLQGEINNGALITLGHYSNTLYLYFLEKNTSTLIQLYEFEHNIKAMQTFGDFAIFLDWNDRLLVTDGTPSGTTLIQQFADVFYAEELQNKVSDGIIFRADNQVWKTDGTSSGTQPISAFTIGTFDKYVQSGDYVYFTKDEYNPYRNVLWRTDGTDAGTQLITSVQDTFNTIDYVYPIDGGIMFFGETDEHGTEIWTCMENQDESQLLIDIIPGAESGVNDHSIYGFSLQTEGDVVFFRGGAANSGQIWKTDGTLSNTEMIIDFTGQTGYDNFEIDDTYLGRSAAGKDFFFTESDDNEYKFWSFDEVSQTTTFLTDFPTNYFTDSASSGDNFYFLIYSVGGNQLWVSDGTPTGTMPLETYPGQVEFIGTKDDLLFFVNTDNQPHVSDGTVSGTGLLKDIQVDPGSSVFVNFNHNFVFDYNNICHLYAFDNVRGLAIYTTDGTEQGTLPAADVYPNTGGIDIDYLTKVKEKLYFVRDDKLWVSDGTASGSTNLNISYNNLSSYYGKTETHLFFVSNDTLYATDGTLPGTFFLLPGDDFFGTFDYSDFGNHEAATMNNLLWFFYDDGVNGLELYRSDGTPLGTYAAFESLPNEESIYDFNSSDLEELNGNLYFKNEDPVFGTEVWSSDGTLAGTSIFIDINAGSAYSSPQLFKRVNGKIYFSTYSGTSNTWSTYVTDGTVGGTIKLADVAISTQYGVATIGNEIVFCSFKNLWKTDGTAAGTVLIQENNRQPNYLTSFGDKVIFSLDDDINDEEPWVTDGTPAGTHLLKDFNPGNDAAPEEFSVIQNLAFFSVDTSGFGYRKLWVSEGSESSTYLSSYTPHLIRNVKDFQKINNKLYFIGDSPIYGKEIHYFEFILPVVTVSGKVFHDENGDGDFDNNESGVLNIKIISGNGDEYTTYTNDEGDYELSLPDGDYIIEPLYNQCWEITSDSSSYSVTVEGTEIDQLDFALNNTIDTPMVETSLYSAITRCGFTVPFWLNIGNQGCDTASSVIRLELDSLVTFVDAAITPDSILGQTLVWNIDPLNINQQIQISLNLLMPGEQANNETIHNVVNVFTWDADTLALSDQYNYYSIISCAIDPNDKRVMPNREDLSEENYTLFEEALTYQIRFQNTGSDTAFTVRIIDTISNFLDLSTLTPIAGSHPYVVNTYPNNIVEFLFEDILLPDSTTNEIASHGFVVFEIKTLPGIDEFSEINNTAHIYFDFNSAVVTNTITNTMVSTFDNDGDGFDIWNDCDDTDPNINATNPEVVYNGVDDDCDPLTLDDDLDQDGFVLADDCDDNNPNINPDVAEIPYNGIDEDCDPLTFDDDLDQDGFLLADDCDDNNANINPDVVEVPYNGIDEDCDPLTLDDDLDQDGFLLADDCNDNNANINPDVVEIPYNGIDEDCDPLTLDDDLDQDGFVLADDCDDNNLDINPDATEIPNNGIDEDCDGTDLMVSSENIIQPALTIFPNPTKNVVIIELPYHEKAALIIKDYQGKEIFKGEFIGNTTIDLKDFAGGIYWIQVSTKDHSWIEKVIKLS